MIGEGVLYIGIWLAELAWVERWVELRGLFNFLTAVVVMIVVVKAASVVVTRVVIGGLVEGINLGLHLGDPLLELLRLRLPEGGHGDEHQALAIIGGWQLETIEEAVGVLDELVLDSKLAWAWRTASCAPSGRRNGRGRTGRG